MNLKETYNLIAKNWQMEINKNHWWLKGMHKFMSFLPKGAEVLDVGCGPGISADGFAMHGFKITGFDFSENMVELAKEKVPSGNFFVLDVKDIDSIQNVFEGIFMQNVLLHIPKKEAFKILSLVIKKLRQGGYFYLSVSEKKPDGPDEEIKREDNYGYSYERFFSYFTQEEIKQYINNLGLELAYFEIVLVGSKKWIQAIAKKIQ